MKKSSMILLILFLGTTFVSGHFVWSQLPPRPEMPQPAPAVQPPTAPGWPQPGPDVPVTVSTVGRGGRGAPNPFAAAQSATSKVVRKLRENKDETKRSELIKELEAAVSTQFDEDMKVREGDITKLEERIANLRTQLDRRRRAKPEITQLQTKVLINEADGLGFSNTPTGGAYQAYPMASPDAFRVHLPEK